MIAGEMRDGEGERRQDPADSDETPTLDGDHEDAEGGVQTPAPQRQADTRRRKGNQTHFSYIRYKPTTKKTYHPEMITN